jgi:hypothetical protein
VGVRIPPSAPAIYDYFTVSPLVNWSSRWSNLAASLKATQPAPGWTLPDRASSLVESALFDLRFVPPLAAVCRSFLLRKGKKRATSSRKVSTQMAPIAFGEGQASPPSGQA